MKRNVSMLLLCLAASLLGIGCGPGFKLNTPDGFVELEDQEEYAFRATTAQGVVMSVRVEPNRPKGNLGPRYTIEYHVPGPEGDAFSIEQDLYPYAQPSAVTYMKPGQRIFDMATVGGWWSNATLKDDLVALGLPESASAAEDASSAGFFSTGTLGLLVIVLLGLGGATLVMRRRFKGDATA